MGEAFSSGLGLAMGLFMGQRILRPLRPRKVVVKQVVICQNCAAKNPIKNKFCSNCGQSLYPLPQITCQKCKAKITGTMKFCGNCGSPLEKQSS